MGAKRISKIGWEKHQKPLADRLWDKIKKGAPFEWSHLRIEKYFHDPSEFKGEANGSAKLTEETVKAARAMVSSGMSVVKVAKQFGVNGVTIWHAITRRTWKHVP